MDEDPFASEHEEEEIWPCAVQSTGILMLSLPDSLEDQITPPEHSRTQSISSSEDQVPAIVTFDPHTVRTIDSGGDAEMLAVDSGCTDTESTVDLGKDSGTLEFSEPKLVKGIEGMDAKKTTDLGKNSHTLGDLEPKLMEGINCDDTFIAVESDCGVIKEENFEPRLKKFWILENGHGASSLAKNIDYEKSLCSESPNVYADYTKTIVIKSEHIEIGETHVLDSEFEENSEGLGVWSAENTVNVDKLVKGTELGCGVASSDIAGGNGGGPLASKYIEDIDKFKYVACGGADKCGIERGVLRHEVSGSLKEKEKNDGLWVPRISLDKKRTFKELLDALGIIVNDSEDTDFLETTKKRGWSFPRPRWWPAEGFDDHVVD